MAKISTVAFEGKSGKKYIFDVWRTDQAFRPIGAIYAVTRRYENTSGSYSHHVIYIGETGDLSTRFGSHHKENCFTEHNVNCICTLVEDDEELRLVQEDDLVRSYNPPCNG
jgi:hypothetical protein